MRLSRYIRRKAIAYLRQQLDDMAVWLLREWTDGAPPKTLAELRADLREALEYVLKHGRA